MSAASRPSRFRRRPPRPNGCRIGPTSACSPPTRDANERVVNDSWKDWWPAASVTFGPQLLTPAGLFQPSRTWSLSLQVSQPIFDGGERRGVRRQREAIFEASKLSLEQLQIEARSEVRIARAAVEAQRARARQRARGRRSTPTKC